MIKKKAYVIGTEVDKSLSPLIFNHWFKKYKINASYQFKVIKEKNFNKDVKKILNEKNLCGLNVTIPFKEKILKKMDNLDSASKTIKAVNCVTLKNNKYYGSNTDWLGFNEALTVAIKKNKVGVKGGEKVILLGYGGSAKAILYCLSFIASKWKKKIFVFNRSKKRIKIPLVQQKTTLPLGDIEKHLSEAFLVVNTIPRNILSDLKIKKTNKQTLVCDIVYKPKETNFLNHFTNPTTKIYGIHMLINQAKPCFFNWFGVRPTTDKALFNKLLKKISK